MIGIIGAGLSGLTAGKLLNERGIDFKIIEKSDRVGGRVKSDFEDGYIFDHGFQVLLTSYPQAKKHLDLMKLSLGHFEPGAEIYNKKGHSFKVGDPLRRPSSLFETLGAPMGGLIDKLKILSLRLSTDGKSLTTMDYLKDFGFSDKAINNFFIPFFSGIFLEKELKTPADYFLFLYKKFGEGLASLPEKGMQDISSQLSSSFNNKIVLNESVQEITAHKDGVKVITSNENYEFEKVILAVDALTANNLLKLDFAPKKERSVQTVYFSAPKFKQSKKNLLLNSTGIGRVNHIAFLSQTQKSYAPAGKELISVNILDSEPIDLEKIRDEIMSWELDLGTDWSFLKTYFIKYAQPDSTFAGEFEDRFENIYLAGDYTQTASIEGAMKSGELAAKKVIGKLEIV